MTSQEGSRAETVAALAAETIARTGQLRMRATGASMLPALRPGDELEFVAPTEAITPGDIVLWRRDGRLFVHRVFARSGETILTRGDSLPQPDSPLVETEVLGKLTTYQRGARRRHASHAGVLDRCCSWVLRRSDTATRLFLHWHGLSQRIRA